MTLRQQLLLCICNISVIDRINESQVRQRHTLGLMWLQGSHRSSILILPRKWSLAADTRGRYALQYDFEIFEPTEAEGGSLKESSKKFSCTRPEIGN